MTNPTDPRVEAAARAICVRFGFNPDETSSKLLDYKVLEANWEKYKDVAHDALKAADAAAWRPIESTPKDGETSFDIWVTSKEGGYRISNVMRSDAVWVFDLMEWPDEMVPATHWMPLPTPPKTQ